MSLAVFLATMFIVVSLLAIDAQLRAAGRFRGFLRDSLDAVRSIEPEDGGVAADALPEPVLKWISRAGVPRDTQTQSVFLRQEAELRMGEGKPWQPIDCEQRIGIRTPGFAWVATRRLGPLVLIRIIDAWIAGKGMLQARLLDSISVARLSGPVADRSEAMRYLAELAWAPDAVLRNPALRWHAVSEGAVDVASDSAGGSVAVRLFFDSSGDLVRIRAEARESFEGGQVVSRPWRGSFWDFQEIAGRRLPMRGEVGYEFESGYSAYWKGRVTSYVLEWRAEERVNHKG